MASYLCPYCKNPTTEIRETTSYSSSVVRKRKCLLCGGSHITIEKSEDIDEAFQELIGAAGEVIRQRKLRLYADNNENN